MGIEYSVYVFYGAELEVIPDDIWEEPSFEHDTTAAYRGGSYIVGNPRAFLYLDETHETVWETHGDEGCVTMGDPRDDWRLRIWAAAEAAGLELKPDTVGWWATSLSS